MVYNVYSTYINLLNPFEAHQIFSTLLRTAPFGGRCSVFHVLLRFSNLSIEMGYVWQFLPCLVFYCW